MLLSYFKNYFTREFNLTTHLAVLAFLGICIGLNYNYSIYPNYFRVSRYSEWGVLKLWGMFAFAFLGTIGLIAALEKQNKIRFSVSFIVLGLLALFFISLDSSYYLLKYGKQLIPIDSPNARFYYKLIANGISLFSILLPCLIIYKIVKKFKPELYGLKRNGANIAPYFVFIGIMIPVIYIAASIDETLLNYYPSYKPQANDATPYVNWLKITIYELFYGVDFISVEVIFRGFMVVGLSRFVGKHAILPMVACYTFLHFGKPMLETIGSVFGGFALGILAFESRNIYGGIAVHLGVAYTMEFIAFVLKA